VEHRSLCQCMTSLHAYGSWLQLIAVHLTPSALQEPLGRTLRQDLRLRAADSPPSE
jgi:hypothetical protein